MWEREDDMPPIRNSLREAIEAGDMALYGVIRVRLQYPTPGSLLRFDIPATGDIIATVEGE